MSFPDAFSTRSEPERVDGSEPCQPHQPPQQHPTGDRRWLCSRRGGWRVWWMGYLWRFRILQRFGPPTLHPPQGCPNLCEFADDGHDSCLPGFGCSDSDIDDATGRGEPADYCSSPFGEHRRAREVLLHVRFGCCPASSSNPVEGTMDDRLFDREKLDCGVSTLMDESGKDAAVLLPHRPGRFRRVRSLHGVLESGRVDVARQIIVVVDGGMEREDRNHIRTFQKNFRGCLYIAALFSLGKRFLASQRPSL